MAALDGSHRDGLPPEVQDALRPEGPFPKVGLAGGEELELVLGQRVLRLVVVPETFQHLGRWRRVHDAEALVARTESGSQEGKHDPIALRLAHVEGAEVVA